VSHEPQPTRYRTLFLSDIHLGTRGCQAELLLEFLKHNEADTIYLVGDIIDGWKLRKGWYWPQAHNDVVQKLLRQVRKGTRMYYLPGNHDDFAREFVGMVFGGVEVVEQAFHVTKDGKRLLVLHGDLFDIVVQNAEWLAHLGDTAYEMAMKLNVVLNKVRRMFGFPYWSLSAWAKNKVKNKVSSFGAYEEALTDAARRHHADGVVCGHIHRADIRDIGGLLYVNTGDFVESCTAVAEHDDGRLEILHWRAASEALLQSAANDPLRVTTKAAA